LVEIPAYRIEQNCVRPYRRFLLPAKLGSERPFCFANLNDMAAF
jgi:hypothetical protein